MLNKKERDKANRQNRDTKTVTKATKKVGR